MSKIRDTDNKRRYWVWIADQRSYLDEDGNDRADLDPRTESPMTVGGRVIKTRKKAI